MSNKIDWLSISLPINRLFSTDFDTGELVISPQLYNEFPYIAEHLMSFPDRKEGGANRIFNRKLHSKLGGFTVFWHTDKPYSLVELTGTGVQVLRERELLFPIVKYYGQFLTRIDIATDWETEVTPKEFAESRETGRFISYSEIKSETGETYYVGSQNSDRFVRVYRYAPPHPRHAFLRREFVLRGAYAKDTASLLQSMRVATLASSLSQTFGFTHPLTASNETTKRIQAPSRTGNMGSTERWLFSQVLPACKKLIDAGQTDIIDIFGKQLYTYFEDRLIQEDNARGAEDLRTNPNFPAS